MCMAIKNGMIIGIHDSGGTIHMTVDRLHTEYLTVYVDDIS